MSSGAGRVRAAIDAVFDVYAGLGGGPAQPGTVYLVGGGPGDPGLLTLRAAALLSTADVVLHDRLSPGEALQLVRPDATVLQVGKRYGEAGLTRGEVDALMAGHAADGRSVVRLKGGDPLVFGRGGEEAAALRLAGIPYEIVSGVTSAVAVPGAAGVPVTHRGLAAGFAVITGHEDPAKGGGHVDFATAAAFSGTLCFLMGVNHLPEIAEQLVKHGRPADTPASVIRWGTTPRQRVVTGTLETIAGDVEAAGLRSPAVTVVGEVAGLQEALAWRERLPLFGKRVLVPRTRAQASGLSARIRTLGGWPIEAPTIEIRPGDEADLRGSLHDLRDGAFVAVCFTSPNGVAAVADAIEALGFDARVFAEVRTIACVGPGTAAALWERLRLRPDLLPPAATTESLAEAFPTGEGRVLLPRADIATELLPAGLQAKGYEPVDVVAYVTGRPDDLPPQAIEALVAGEVDLLAFASSSTARNFVELIGDRPWSGRVVSIGPVTSATCRELGLDVAVEADPHDLDGLVAALVEAAGQASPQSAS